MKYTVLIVLLLSTFLLFFEGLKNDPKIIPSNLISKEIPKFKLPSLDNKSFEDSNLRTKDLKLVNFFASWCPPCKVEHSNLIELSQRLKIFGIAKKDTVQNIKTWFSQMGNPYSRIGFDHDGMVSINWGVYGLPETFIINENQKIIYRHVGAITQKDMKKIKLILDKNK